MALTIDAYALHPNGSLLANLVSYIQFDTTFIDALMEWISILNWNSFVHLTYLYMVTDCVQIIELNRPIAKKEDTHWPFASMTENNVQTLRLTALKFKAMIFGVRCDTIIYFKIGK